MLAPRQSDRIGLLEIASHPWMGGFPVEDVVVAPKPIVFFQINNVSDFLKFRRMYAVINKGALNRACEFLGMTDSQPLRDALNEGLVNGMTTIYYLMLRPCPVEPPLTLPNSNTKEPAAPKKRRSIDGDQKRRAHALLVTKRPIPKIRRPEGGTRSPRLRV
jgi:hypothetical protein